MIARPYGLTLLPQHAELLKASAVTPEVATARGYRSIETKAALQRLGISPTQCNVPALLIPVHDVTGQVSTCQIRPGEPRAGKNGEAVKYETPGAPASEGAGTDAN